MLNSQKSKEPRHKTGNFNTSHVKNTQSLFQSLPGPQGKETRRQSVLNALFMEYITDLMASGEVSRELVGRKIQIVGVKVSNDFTILNVKWAGGDRPQDDKTQEILNRSAGPLRSELIGLNVLGKVPQIQFVRDRTYAISSDVDQILATADYGPDYEPTYRYQLEPVHVLRGPVTKEHQVTSSSILEDIPANAGLMPENKQDDSYDARFASKTKKLKQAKQEEVEEAEAIVPVSHDSKQGKMRMDLLGLKHDVLMSKVQEAMKRARGQHRLDGSDLQEEITSGAGVHPHKTYPSLDSQRFAKYLEYRRRKRIAATKKASPDLEAVNYMLDKVDDGNEGPGDSAYANDDSDDEYFEDERLLYEESEFNSKDK